MVLKFYGVRAGEFKRRSCWAGAHRDWQADQAWVDSTLHLFTYMAHAIRVCDKGWGLSSGCASAGGQGVISEPFVEVVGFALPDQLGGLG